MYNRKFRNIAGVFLLLVFILCNTPTSVLHAMFADHTDRTEMAMHSGQTAKIDATGIDCFCNGNVVSTPYYFDFQPADFPPLRFYHLYREVLNKTYISPTADFFSLRAPPVLN
ncbi:MAG: hypothetical protein J5I50_07790 [Chitinophagaceae bacterium]|nr:hypothetical protein [Chitinophagaceae bacterium]